MTTHAHTHTPTKAPGSPLAFRVLWLAITPVLIALALVWIPFRVLSIVLEHAERVADACAQETDRLAGDLKRWAADYARGFLPERSR